MPVQHARKGNLFGQIAHRAAGVIRARRIAGHRDATCGGLQEAEHAFEEGRLAGTVMAEQSELLAGRDIEANVPKRLQVGEGHADAVDLENGGLCGPCGHGGPPFVARSACRARRLRGSSGDGCR